jgi:hypothetical protein
MTWPFVYSNEIGHVGEFQANYSNLIDTPRGMEDKDYYQWYPNHFPLATRILSALNIRLPY